jgi:LysR family transcriptional regulator, hydrogen peroxide-inducible genes activator
MKATPHPFSLRQLQYVVAVAEGLSFRRAAAHCRVAQPSLSAQVAQVEDALGVRLFERNRRRVLVTSAGHEFVARARRLLTDADDLLEAAQLARDPLVGTLRIGVIPTIAPYLLPSAAPQLRARFSRLRIAWREDKTEVLAQALQAGDLQAAIVALEAEIGEVEHEVLGRDAFVLAAGAGHPLLRRHTPVAATELRDAEVLLLDDGHCFREQALEVCSVARAQEGEFQATSLGTLVQMVAGSSAVTLLPAMSVATEAVRAGLRVRALASRRAFRTVALVWRRRAPVAPALKQLATVLRGALSALDVITK